MNYMIINKKNRGIKKGYQLLNLYDANDTHGTYTRPPRSKIHIVRLSLSSVSIACLLTSFNTRM